MPKFVLIIILLFPLLCPAQSIIVGRVIIRSGQAVKGVNIWCDEQKKGTSSDSSGYFELECTLPCLLEFTHINYKKERCSIKNNHTPFLIVLYNKFNNLKEVVITGRASAGRTYSNRKEIEMIPAILGEQDLLKYLATTPGVITTNALNPGIYVRGSNSCENSFLTNNMEIASPDHLTGILSTFDPFMLSNSIIYKSGFPAIYNNYLSSYINMIPDPGNKEIFEGEATLGLVSSAIKIKGPILKNHTSFAASARTSYLQSIAKIYNRSVKKTNNHNYMPEYSFQDITLSVDSRINPRWHFSAFGLFTIDDLSMQIGENTKYQFNWHTLSGNAGAWYTPSEHSSLHFRIGIKSMFSKGNANGLIPMGGGNRNYSVIGRVMYTHTLTERFQIQCGGKIEQARFETADRSDVEDDILIRSSDKKLNIMEGYVDLTYNINKNFTMYGGFNLQNYQGDTKVVNFSPRAKISFLSGRWSLWADYAQTTQYLGLYPYFTVKTPVDIWYPLGKNNKPAICNQTSIGAEVELFQGIFLYAGLFHKRMQHVKDFSTGISQTYTALTDHMIEGKGFAQGIESNIAFNLSKFYLRMNYTLSESKRKFKGINQGRYFYPPYDVKHNLVFNASHELTSRTAIHVLWTFSSGVYTTFPVGVVVANNISGNESVPILIPIYTDRYNYKLPNNHRLDISLDYIIPYEYFKLMLSLGAYNAYNQSNPSFIYFTPEKTNNDDLKFTPKSKIMLPFIPYISLRIKW